MSSLCRSISGRTTVDLSQSCQISAVDRHRIPGPLGWYPNFDPRHLPDGPVTGIRKTLVDWWLTTRQYPAPLLLLIDGLGQFTDAGATPAVVGDAVYQWTNLADAANPAVQATAGNRPDRTTTGLDFNGSTDFVQIAGYNNVGNDCTVVAVVDVDTNVGQESVAGLNIIVLAATSDLTQGVGAYDPAGSGWKHGCAAKTSKQVLAWRWTGGSSVVEFYRDGVKLGQDTYSASFATKTDLMIGAYYTPSPMLHFDGKILALAVFNSSLSDANLAIVHREMLARYSLTFDRASIAGMVYWALPDAAHVTLNGADVAAVLDRAATPHNLTQAVAGNQPLWLAAGGPNGTPAVEHDGVDEYLATAAFTLNQPWHEFIIAKPHVAKDANYSSLVCGLGSSTSGWAYTINANSIGQHAGTNQAGTAGSDNDQWQRLTFLGNGASSSIYKNGALVAGVGNAGANARGGFYVGYQTGVGRYLDGAWAEHVVYNRALNTYEIAANDALTLVRYGL